MIDYLENNDNIHPGIRRSLFPNVPPYIKFSYNAPSKPLPTTIRNLMKWKESGITPEIVYRIVKNNGFTVEECRCWSGQWGNQMRGVDYQKLHEHQKFNHFPSTFNIGRKDSLWRNIRQMKQKYGDRKFDITPPTYVLPDEKKSFRVAWERTEKMKKEQCWILKPPARYRGEGIKLISKFKHIPKNEPYVAQKYILNPYLINDTKFDLRLYVLLTSVNPLRVYLYNDGLTRFASVKYSFNFKNLDNHFMHLTNYSVNKENVTYEINSDAESRKGHKWTLKTLWKYLAEHRVDVKKLKEEITDLVVKTVICVEDQLNKAANDNLRSRYNAYELFGFDVLLDTNLKPWLLEVNVSPSLHTSTKLDLVIKAPLIINIFNLVGFHIPVSKKHSEEQLAMLLGKLAHPVCLDSRLYTVQISNHEKYKHHMFTDVKQRADYLNKILEDLTPEDVRLLVSYEDELTQIGSFIKVFPTPETYKYLKYFKRPSYYNLLFDAWETKYHENREEGRDLLRSLCRNEIHFKLPRTGSYSR